MPRNIVIHSDGTGQRGGVMFDERRSNIYKLYRATRCGPDSPVDPKEQYAFYDAGIGTSKGARGVLGAAWDMIVGLFTGWGEASPLVTGGVLLAIAVGIGSQYLPARLPRLVMARFSRLPVLGQATVLALALVLTSVLGPEGVAPFIYFQF